MKKLIFYIVIIACGILIFAGPTYLFKVCAPGCCSSYPECHWLQKAMLGMGMIITALGVFLFIFNDNKIQLGMTIGLFLVGIITLLCIYVIIGGCTIKTMNCRLLTIPILTILGIIVTVYSGVNVLIMRKK